MAVMDEEYNTNVVRAELVTKWPLVAYLLTAIFCMGISSTCHLCFVASEKMCKVTSYLDFWGIALMCLGSSYPYISFKYACGPFIIWRYVFTGWLTFMTIVCMYATI